MPQATTNRTRNEYNPYDEEEITYYYPRSIPQYPDEIFQNIQKCCASNGGQFDLAVDMGCGSGQATVPLGSYYRKVVGLDLSGGMIAAAPKHLSNVTFSVADCSYPLAGIHNSSVDLVCVATAVHWLDRDKIFAEADRILKPGGHLAVIAFYFPSFIEPKLNVVVDQIRSRVPEVYPERAKLFYDRLQSLVLPYPNEKRFPEMLVEKETSIDHFTEIVRSSHHFCLYLREHPGLMEEMKQKMLETLGAEPDSSSEDIKVKIQWPYNHVITQKPRV